MFISHFIGRSNCRLKSVWSVMESILYNLTLFAKSYRHIVSEESFAPFQRDDGRKGIHHLLELPLI